MSDRDRLYLVHISDCLSRIESYLADGSGNLLADMKTQDAVLRNLQTLGESTKRLSEEIKAANAEVDWTKVVGLRNVLVHDYLGVDLDLIREAIEQHLPQLRETVERILEVKGWRA